jgi:hypothetical protein
MAVLTPATQKLLVLRCCPHTRQHDARLEAAVVKSQAMDGRSDVQEH